MKHHLSGNGGGLFSERRYLRQELRWALKVRVSLIDKERAFNMLDLHQPEVAKKKVSVAQWALTWLLHQRSVTGVVIGANHLN